MSRKSKSNSICPKDLQHISILFPGDLYNLASFIVKANAEKSKIKTTECPGSKITIYSTVRVLANYYSVITDISSSKIIKQLEDSGIDVSARIQSDDD